MLQRPSDLRPCGNNFNVKYLRFVLKSKHQPSVAPLPCLFHPQNAKSGLVGSQGPVGLGTCLEGYPKGETFNRELWKYLCENLGDGDWRLICCSRRKELLREKKVNKQEGKAASTSERFTWEGRKSCRQYLLERGEATREEHLEQVMQPWEYSRATGTEPPDPDSLCLLVWIIP